MAYANRKGKKAEIESAKFYSKITGFKVVRVGNVEKNKKIMHGDNVVINDPDRKCVLSDYFLETKCREKINIFEILEEAESNARTYGKYGSIIYAVKQKKGNWREGTAIIMTKETFGRIIQELQGYRNSK